MHLHLHPGLVDVPFPTHLSKRVEQVGRPTPVSDWLTRAGALVMYSAAPVRRFLLDTVVRDGPTLQEVPASVEVLDEFLTRRVNLASHHSGTARMGAADDPTAVVDPECAVYGTSGLHVVDASVMPGITRTNLNLPTIMVAERASDLLHRRAGAAR